MPDSPIPPQMLYLSVLIVSLLVVSVSVLILLNALGQGDRAQAWIAVGYFVAASGRQARGAPGEAQVAHRSGEGKGVGWRGKKCGATVTAMCTRARTKRAKSSVTVAPTGCTPRMAPRDATYQGSPRPRLGRPSTRPGQTETAASCTVPTASRLRTTCGAGLRTR